MSNHKIPPIIMRLISTPRSALEMLIPQKNNKLFANTDNVNIVFDETKLEKYILSQYILYLYILIFVTPYTSHVYTDFLYKSLQDLRLKVSKTQNVDLQKLLNESLIDKYFDSSLFSLFETLISRIRPEENYIGLNNIIDVVKAIYNPTKSYRSTEPVIIFNTTIEYVDGYDRPAFVLSPIFQISLDTTPFRDVKDHLWKLIYSMNIKDQIKAPGDLTDIMTCLAQLALPLDPISLTNMMNRDISTDNKSGIPFLNYIAMYLKQKAMGLNYQLSSFADARRILMRRLHQFCGIGGVSISDRRYVALLIKMRDDEDQTKFAKEDKELLKIIELGEIDSVNDFTKSLQHHALEAVKAKSKSTDDDIDGSFADDSDTLSDDTTSDKTNVSDDTTTNTAQNQDDNMDRTSDVGQEPAVANTKVFMPLALPTETIDDHLLRLAVLRLANDLDTDQAPDITPENLDILKYWCGSWLFIASIDQTKKLLSRLNLTGKMKELS